MKQEQGSGSGMNLGILSAMLTMLLSFPAWFFLHNPCVCQESSKPRQGSNRQSWRLCCNLFSVFLFFFHLLYFSVPVLPHYSHVVSCLSLFFTPICCYFLLLSSPHPWNVSAVFPVLWQLMRWLWGRSTQPWWYLTSTSRIRTAGSKSSPLGACARY